MRRGMVCMWVAVAALAAWGMPTQKEIDQVKPLVEELMASQKRAKPQEAAEAAVGFVADAESEAAKFLLYRTALELYAKAGDDEKTVETFMGLIETIPDVPYGVRAKLLQDAGRAIGKIAKPMRTEALYKQQTTLAVIDRELQKALKEIEVDPNDVTAHLRAGNALAIFGEWPKALEHLSVSESAVAAVADEERTGRVSINESADGWWKTADTIRNATLKNAYRSHAVDLYRKAIADGTLTGLGKTLAERKIAEFEKEPEVIRPQRGGSGKPYLYCVIDLSGGPKAKKYPVSYLQKEPSTKTGFNTDEYKTTKLVLRRIEPGKFIMGEDQKDKSRRVTLTKPFYIGIYEVTQKQYELVTGETPSEFKGDMRPVEKVSYDMIRGKSEGAKWPSSSVVDPESFMGKIRARTGLDFDLPTEAQWEYACRAGTASAFNNGGNSEDDLKKLGRFTLNQNSRGWLESDADFARHKPDGRGGHLANHTVVGSYMPNRWGLYDMHGNVWEWCCDLKGDLANSLTDPKGVVSGDARVLRGGSWDNLAGLCRSAYRRGGVPGRRDGSSGFRLVRTVSE
ncbi:MAG: formylglycine-generating enzyme family protein [Kiritimatiellae bacterium]|nr:formylglycine-generating enzyme family protein [Kiritimatiellia bacterium]